MPTMPARRLFIHQAIGYFLRQSYPNKELIVVDDAPGNPDEFRHYPPSVKYMTKDGNTFVGAKMNYGIEHAASDVIHKMDDDDWYHPDLLDELWVLMQGDVENTITRLYGCAILLLQDWKLKITGERQWLLGASIMFHRKLWKRNKFDETVNGGSDYKFRKNVPYREAILMRKDRLMFLRHGVRHTWTATWGDVPADDYLGREPDHPMKIEDVIPAEDVTFYRDLRSKLADEAKAIQPA
jgi:glycosyltransferase involved in cell wall biosynthesis